MASEQDIIQRESGGNPYVGYTGVDLSGAPRDQYGFPIWEGRMGPAGRSRAAGLYQFEPKTWAEGASALGITDFSPQSQKQVYDYTRAKYGEAPWAASATGYSQGTAPGEQRHGGTYVGVVRPEDGFSVGGALLLNNLLQQQRQAREAADKDTGNPLLNQIIQQSLDTGPQQTQAQPFDTTALQQATPRPQTAATQPELAGGPVPQAQPMQPLTTIEPPSSGDVDSRQPQSATMYRPGVPMIPGTQDNPLYQPGLGMNPPGAAPIPGTLDKNRFWNEDQRAPYNIPGGEPDDRVQPISGKPVIEPSGKTVEAGLLSGIAKTGNALLDKLLQLIPDPVRSTIDTDKQRQLQAGLWQAIGEDLRDLKEWAYPSKPQEAQPPQTGKELLDRMLTGIGEVPPPSTDIEQSLHEQAATSEGPLSIPERITQLGEETLPYLGGGAVEEGGVVLGAGPTFRRGRGGRGGPPREPPPLSEEPRALPPPPTAVSPRVEPREVAVPGTALQPTPGGAGGGAGEPPIWRGGGAETAGPPPPKGKGGESREVKNMRIKAMNQTADALSRHHQRQNAWVGVATRGFNDIRKRAPMTPEQKLQIEKYLEWQPGMPQVAIDAEAKARADNFIKPMREQSAEDWIWLEKERATDKFEAPLVDEASEGYLHRMRAFSGGVTHPYDPFGRMRSLSRSASSMQHRTFYVVQGPNGERIPVHITDGKPAPKPGTVMYRVSPPGGGTTRFEIGEPPAGEAKWEVRRATTEEIEANTDVRYLHDPELATFQNWIELGRARENVEFLKGQLLPELKNGGLSVPSQLDARRMSSVRGRPWKETDIPTLKGHYFEPRIADTFNDFYRTPSLLSGFGEGANIFGAINRFGINALFVNPVPHMRNAFWDAVLARGDLWWNPASYPGAANALREAFKDTTFIYQRNGKISPFYAQLMLHGAPLMSYNAQTSLAINVMMRRALKDMTKIPNLDNVARSTGVFRTGKELVKAMWNQSQKAMWWFHDTLMAQAVRERMARGMTMDEAIKASDRFIADYRVPATVGEKSLRLSQPVARGLSRLMQDRSILAFGRYHYNKLRTIFNIVADFGRALGPSGMSGPQRAAAVGRFATMLLWGTVLQGGVNYILKKVTDNPNAHFRLGGAPALTQTISDVGYDLAWKQSLGDAAHDFLGGMAAVITPMPGLLVAAEQYFNRAYPGGPEIAGPQLPAREQAIQRAVHAAGGLVPPVENIIEPRSLLRDMTGINIPENAVPRPPGGYINPREFRTEQRRFERQLPWFLKPYFAAPPGAPMAPRNQAPVPPPQRRPTGPPLSREQQLEQLRRQLGR